MHDAVFCDHSCEYTITSLSHHSRKLASKPSLVYKLCKNVGQMSTTVSLHSNNIGPAPVVYWEASLTSLAWLFVKPPSTPVHVVFCCDIFGLVAPPPPLRPPPPQCKEPLCCQWNPCVPVELLSSQSMKGTNGTLKKHFFESLRNCT